MSGSFAKRIITAICAAGLAAGTARAESVDFESAAYIVDKTVVGTDGWLLNQGDLLPNQDNFKTATGSSGPGTGGKFLRALTSTTTTIYRPFQVTSAMLDIRWKWRAASEKAHLCIGVAPAAGVARLVNRALVCLEPGGTVATQGGGLSPAPVEASWEVGVWHYMRMVVDHGAGSAGKFAVYMSEDSLRYGERAIQTAIAMGASGPVARLVVRDEAGDGYVDVDDISWEAIAIWQGSPDVDSSWSLGKNWSTGLVPDSNTHVAFSEVSQRGVALDKNVWVRSISVASGWKGTLNLGQQFLTVLGKADFSGGSYQYSGPGMIRFPSPRGTSLTGPEGTKFLPTVRHDGPGVLRLDGRALSVANLTQVQGSFDFNGLDLYVLSDLIVKNGQPHTFHNLDGRSIVASRSVRLEGTNKDTLLGLVAPTRNWTLNLSGGDTLAARFANLGRASATGNPGYAFQSVDGGGNTGWTFLNAPTITAQPRDTSLKVGETAMFKATAAPKAGLAFQWYRNDVEIPGAKDSAYYLPGLRKADSGAVFNCKISNPGGFVYSAAATLKVAFPPPTALPGPQPILDSLNVVLAPGVGGSKVWYSRNGAAFQPYATTLSLKDSTTLRAYATFNGDTSGVIAYVYPKPSQQQLPEPSINPEPISFSGSLTITMAPPVTGAKVFYTLDNSDPDSIKGKPYAGAFLITTTITVRAIAYLAGYRPSVIHTHFYSRIGDAKLGPPSADPPGGPFTDSVVVRLLPPAEAPAAALFYFLDKAGPFRYSDTARIVMRESGSLKALASADAKISDTVQWAFQRRLEAPAATPKGSAFTNTLRVFLNTKVDGASIRFTVDGTDPLPTSPLFPGAGLLLDSSVDLKAVAVKGSEVSAKLAETYTLIPDTPGVSHRGGDYSSRITLSLDASTPRATLWYTLDGTTPGPEGGSIAYQGPFDLDRNATLKAVAVAGTGSKTQRSPLRIENYAFITPGNRVLGPGQRIELSGNYAIISPNPGAASVQVEVIAADTIALGLRGFRDILFGIKVSLPENASSFPDVVFKAPAGEPRALFQLLPQKQVRYVTSADSSRLAAPGTYFLATDFQPPVIKFSGETFTDKDSTRVVVTIEDNVNNLLLDVTRSDTKTESFAGREINPTLVLAINMKAALGSLSALTLRIRVDDHSDTTTFPADGSVYPMAQRITGTVRTPAAFRIGLTPADPWDLIAVPLATDKALSLAQLRKNNDASGLQGALIDKITGKYRFITADEPIYPGASVWLASTAASIPSLAFPGLQTVSRKGAGICTLTLHPGWNQVSNPTLAKRYWPVSRNFADAYQNSLLKGLHAWDAAAVGYAHAEALEPWRGYLAYYKGSRDTVISLPDHPVSAPPPPRAAKGGAAKGGAVGTGFGLRFVMAGGMDMRLGASALAVDGIGREDEMRPPARSENGTRLFSLRGGNRLETDVSHWRAGSIYSWTVVAGLSARAQGNPDATRSLSGAAEGLPEGYAAWAVSKARGLRFPLAAGAEIPWHAGYADTLEVLAGPAAELESRLAAVPLKAGPFAARVAAGHGGYTLRLDLPAAARIRLTVWTLDGRAVEMRTLDLPEGRYQLAGNRDGRGYGAGLYALQLETSAQGSPQIPKRMALKFAIP